MNRVSEYNKKYGEYLINKPSQSEGDYKCNKCNKIWHPTDVEDAKADCPTTRADINRKAMHTYYKCCGVCRTYLLDKKREAERTK